MSVLESAFPGAGATGAAMGHLVVMDDSEAQFALTAYSRRLWTERVRRAARRRSRTTPCGTLWVAAGRRRRSRTCAQKAAYYEARGERVELLDARALRRGRAAAAAGARRSAARARRPRRSIRRRPRASFSSGRGALGAPGRGRGSRRGGRAADACAAGGRWREADAVVVNAAGADAPRLTPGPADRPAQGPPGDHRPLPRLPAPPGRRARLPEERAHAHARVGGVQRPAAPDRPAARRLVARARGLGRLAQPAALSPACCGARSEYLPALRAARARCARGSASGRRRPTSCRSSGSWEPGLLDRRGPRGARRHDRARHRAAARRPRCSAARPAIDPAPFDPRREMARA